jgi:hypothetical protein
MRTIPHKANAIPAGVMEVFKRRRVEQHPDECWPWTGAHRADGYGVIKFDGKMYKVHRLAYYLAHGELSSDLTVDHCRAKGCRMKSCINPAHLEAVTQSVNALRHHDYVGRKTHCPMGHEYIPGSHGRCPVCNREKQRQWCEDHPERSHEI